MRKTFLYPIISQISKGNFKWILNQIINGIKIKYLKNSSSPVMAVLLVTYKCNSKCMMCDLSKRAVKPEFTTKEWKDIIKQLADIKTAGIGFTGGEPLIRNDIFELMSYAKSLGMVITLNTNAFLLHDENIKKVLEVEPQNINISLDGVNAKTYDFIRGVPNSFKLIIENTKKLVDLRNKYKKKTSITMVCCVSKYNIHELEEIAQLAKSVGADKIGFMPMHYIPNTKVSERQLETMTCKDNTENMGNIFLQQIKTIKKRNIIDIDNSQQYLNMFPAAFAGRNFPIKCLAGETSITIDSLGNIFGCWPFLELKQPSFNIGKKTLKKLWFGKEYEKIRNSTDKCRGCFWNCQSELSIFYK